jgi:CheY-like chemotaxis protein
VADSRADALSLAREVQPEVIVLDLGMPVTEGLAFRLAQVADPDLADIPVVMVSGSLHTLDLARRLGVAGVFLRSDDPGELLDVVHAHCGKAKDGSRER